MTIVETSRKRRPAKGSSRIHETRGRAEGGMGVIVGLK